MSSSPSLSSAEIRTKFLDFFAARSHQILPSASLVPSDPTVLLTIAGMLPFKPIFLGQHQPEFPRVTTSQKCIRTNDIENVGRTARHHTFFEMLGNFSFGDYFKTEAIAWGWELVTTVFHLPPEQLVVSVYHEDDESFAIWRDQIGIPERRIQRMGDDNFWASGPTGPCGPCSELYYDFHPEAGDQTIDLEDGHRFLEIYNLVFMELNRQADGSLVPLQKQNIDTGMGLERMAQVLQGVPNNYETDGLFPVIKVAAELANVNYYRSEEGVKTSLKVIGDHTRAVVHLVADGVLPSNVGRGYVLRRLVRRLVRCGRQLGLTFPFISHVSEAVIALGACAFPHLQEQRATIITELEREEERFLQTLERGEKILTEILHNPAAERDRRVTGMDAFVLYDTYGFPLELTQEIAAEQGFTVDATEFNAEMAKQKLRSKEAHETIDLLAGDALERLFQGVPTTEFTGYGTLADNATILVLLQEGDRLELAESGDTVQIVLDRTPFYGESGGQVGDRGRLITETGAIAEVTDVQKKFNYFLHECTLTLGSLRPGDRVHAIVSTPERRRIQAHHSATHLLQAALKKLVDANISQAGSLVDGDRLRFDINFARALTATELQQVEDLVNQWIVEAHGAHVAVMPIAEAKARGAIAMFGEKYGAEVRVIDFPQVSMELCGGTHVTNTNEIGVFKIISEMGISAGVRRIEAVAGQSLLPYLSLRESVVKELGDRFKARPEELVDRIAGLQQELKNSQKQLETLQKQLALLKSESLISQSESRGAFHLLVAELEQVDAESLKTAAERLQAKLGDHGAVVLGSIPEDDKVSLVAAFGKGVMAQGLHAGKFIGAIAQQCGGGGGGRPNLAQAGGKNPSQLGAALGSAQQQLRDLLQE